MKNYLKYTGLLLVITFSAISAYYIYSVHRAREYTHQIISLDLKKSQWRHPKGIAQKFEILSNDLSKRQTEILIKVQDPGFYNHNGMDLSTPGGGLTTITQAIVKKLYFANFKPGIAKIIQSLIAMLFIPGTFHIIDHPEWNMDRTNRIKALVNGTYKPKGLMDQFYGELPQEVINTGLPPASYLGNSPKTMRINKSKANKADSVDANSRAAD